MTSGAIQWGVPMKVLRLDMVCVSCAATPKSASFTSPASVSRMLPHFMSLCTYRDIAVAFRVCSCQLLIKNSRSYVCRVWMNTSRVLFPKIDILDERACQQGEPLSKFSRLELGGPHFGTSTYKECTLPMA